MAEHDDDIDEAAGAHHAHDAPVYVLRIGKVPYAVGLLWNEVDEGDNGVVEARKMAARPGIDSDLYLVRAGGKQYGLGRKSEGHLKGMPSLAAHLADSVKGSFCGVFEVEGGYYVVAVGDEIVRSESDRFYSDANDARNAFDEVHSARDWDEVYAVGEFAVDNAGEAQIQNLLTGRPKTSLQEIDRVSNTVRLLVFGVLALAVVGGGMWYYQYLNQLADYDALRRIQEAALGSKPKEAPRPKAPWEDKFVGAEYVQDCVSAMSKAILAFPGWQPVSLTCDGSGTTVTMNISRTHALGQGGGTINWVRWALDNGGMKNASASPEGDNGVKVTWNFDKQPMKYPPDVGATHKLMEVRRYVQANFEEMFVPVKFEKESATSPFFSDQKFTFTSNFDPMTFIPILDKVAGLTVDKITYDILKHEYKLEVEAHDQQSAQPAQGVSRPVKPQAAK